MFQQFFSGLNKIEFVSSPWIIPSFGQFHIQQHEKHNQDTCFEVYVNANFHTRENPNSSFKLDFLIRSR